MSSLSLIIFESCLFLLVQFSSVQSLSHVQLFAIPWTAACQASLSITNMLKLMSTLKLVLWPNIWSALENVPCVLEKNVYCVAVGWNVLYMFVRFIWSAALFKSAVYWFLSGWSISCWEWDIKKLMRFIIARAVVLNRGWFCPPGYIWQCLETFLVFTAGEEGHGFCYQPLVSWGQRCC